MTRLAAQSAAEPERVLVLGDDMRIFLTVVRSLGRAGKEVHVAPTDPGSPALRSRYIARVHHLPGNVSEPAAWLTALNALVAKHRFRLILPCMDRDILACDAARDRLAAPVALPPAAAMDLLFDKAQTRALAGRCGVPVSPGALLGEGDTAESLVARFGLPLIVKPRRSFAPDDAAAGSKVWVVESAAELTEVLARLGRRDRYLAEAFAPGVGVGVSVLAADGAILQAFQHRRLRQGKGGCSSLRVSEALEPELLAAAEAITRAANLTGVCMFEFRWNDADRGWVLLETNARFWGSIGLPVGLGLDFPALLYDLLVHGVRPAPRAYRTGLRSRNLFLDGFNVLRDAREIRRRGLGTWIADLGRFVAFPVGMLRGAEISDTIVRDDLRPALFELADVWRALARRIRKPRPPVGAPGAGRPGIAV